MSASADYRRDLIFDIGANNGEDTEFYLAKGFRVVSVEADPDIGERLREQFAEAIREGRLYFENVGIMDKPGALTFYRNLGTDLWSSFDPEYGCRGGKYETVTVDCVTLHHLLAKYGCPYFMKIDVEGADRIVLDQLAEQPARPAFLSVEEFGFPTLPTLATLGFSLFSLRTQLDKSWATSPQPPLEGRHVARQFRHTDSGAFGREVPEWMSLAEAKVAYGLKVRGEGNVWLPPPNEWYDVHACARPGLLGLSTPKAATGGAATQWEDGVDAELAFWRDQAERIAGGIEPNQGWRLLPREIDSHYRGLIPEERRAGARVLDVGAGPFSHQGCLLAGQPITLVCVDALADHYTRALRDLSLHPPAPTLRCDAEALSGLFAPGSFDLVTSTNTLDLTRSPVDALGEMFKVCRPGGSVLVEMREDDGKHEGYAGFHRFNIRVENGALVIWTPAGMRVNLDEHFRGQFAATRKFVDDHPWRKTDWGARAIAAHYVKI